MKKSSKPTSFTPLLPLSDLVPYLLGWYDTVHTNRDMPWRQTRDPYAIWLSETMLQQTQVETVKPYYHRFLESFPTVADLARADLDSVLTLWAGLGYYRRARNLHAAAQAIVERHAGQLPTSLDDLLALPGIGRYTAGAVASIAFGLPTPVVDGNVMRVLARLTGFDRNIADPKNASFFWQAAEEIVRGNDSATSKGALASERSADARPGDVNQALMELGATVCVPPPARPACLLCPIKSFCRAFAEGRQLELPVKEKKKPVPEIRGAALVVFRHEQGGTTQVLMMKRPAGVTWENMWEFPVLPAVTKSKRNKIATGPLGMTLTSPRPCNNVVHTLTHRRMIYDVFSATWKKGAPALPPCPEGGAYTEFRWVEWPLAKHRGMAFGRVVERIAQVVSDS